MSLYDYQMSQRVNPEISFYGLIMACMRQADTDNTERLKTMWPDVWDELQTRYHAPGGMLPSERDALEPKFNYMRGGPFDGQWFKRDPDVLGLPGDTTEAKVANAQLYVMSDPREDVMVEAVGLAVVFDFVRAAADRRQRPGTERKHGPDQRVGGERRS